MAFLKSAAAERGEYKGTVCSLGLYRSNTENRKMLRISQFPSISLIVYVDRSINALASSSAISESPQPLVGRPCTVNISPKIGLLPSQNTRTYLENHIVLAKVFSSELKRQSTRIDVD